MGCGQSSVEKKKQLSPEDRECLKHVGFFNNLADKEIEVASTDFETVHFQAGVRFPCSNIPSVVYCTRV